MPPATLASTLSTTIATCQHGYLPEMLPRLGFFGSARERYARRPERDLTFVI
jgi:hypothetical protein